MSEQYRVGIVGCGNIGKEHARAYAATGRATIVAGADVKEENAAALADAHQARAYSCYEEMFGKEELDVISVCTWPRTHCEIVTKAAGAVKKGIMCEKPLAVSLGEADQMLDACSEAGLRIAVGHQHRFDAQTVKARELIAAGTIGDLKMIWAHCCLDLMNNGGHVIDLINSLVGDVPAKYVIGQIDRRRQRLGASNHPDMYVEDMASAEIIYENDVRAFVEIGEFAPRDYSFYVRGTEGFLDVNAPGQRPVRYLTPSTGGWVEPELGPADPRRAEMDELFDAIEQDREHESSGQRGRATLEILVSVFESSRRRGMVDLPTDVRDFPLESMITEGVI